MGKNARNRKNTISHLQPLWFYFSDDWAVVRGTGASPLAAGQGQGRRRPEGHQVTPGQLGKFVISLQLQNISYKKGKNLIY